MKSLKLKITAQMVTLAGLMILSGCTKDAKFMTMKWGSGVGIGSGIPLIDITGNIVLGAGPGGSGFFEGGNGPTGRFSPRQNLLGIPGLDFSLFGPLSFASGNLGSGSSGTGSGMEFSTGSSLIFHATSDFFRAGLRETTLRFPRYGDGCPALNNQFLPDGSINDLYSLREELMDTCSSYFRKSTFSVYSSQVLPSNQGVLNIINIFFSSLTFAVLKQEYGHEFYAMGIGENGTGQAGAPAISTASQIAYTGESEVTNSIVEVFRFQKEPASILAGGFTNLTLQDYKRAIVNLSAGHNTGMYLNGAHTVAGLRQSDESPFYELIAWGDDTRGQIGNGDLALGAGFAPTNTYEPQAVLVESSDPSLPPEPITNVIQFAVGGAHTCAIRANDDPSSGKPFCFGARHAGQTGIAERDDSGNIFFPGPGNIAKPVILEGEASDQDFTSVKANNFNTFLLSKNGNVYGFGKNDRGQTGTRTAPTVQPILRPELVIGLDGSPLNNIVEISARGETACALSENGNLYCWGVNPTGCMLGKDNLLPVRCSVDDPTKCGVLPTPIATQVKRFSMGLNYIIVTKFNGDILSNGDNSVGQLGIGDPWLWNTCDQGFTQTKFIRPEE